MIKLNLDKKLKYLLACSFGPDSMALFHLLKENGYNFDCAIVNYHLREESNFEVEGLVSYAQKNGVKVFVHDVKEKIKKNIEATCRSIRYNFFKDLVIQNGYDKVLVAHHQDDLIETYLLQKQRQNCPIFYGIKENTIICGVNIERPLLSFTKKELLQICLENNVPFSVDKTNFDVSIKRNKIRSEIVSKMSALDRANIIKQINDENAKLSHMIKSIDLSKLNEVEYILSLDAVTLKYALNIYAKNVDNSLYLSKENVGQVIDILNSRNPNGQFKIKNGLFVIKEYSRFYFVTEKFEQKKYIFEIKSPSKLDVEFFYLDFTGDTSNRNVSLSDYPLTIRNVKPTDQFVINGYKVSARRLLIDWKVPFRKRLIWPVILNKNGVCIYIPRYQSNFKADSNCNFYVK